MPSRNSTPASRANRCQSVQLAGVLFLLGIYAAGWQVMLKKFNLGVAYANRSAVVILSLIHI